jgi:hypothetical protein
MQLLRRLIALFCSWSLVWAGLAWPTLAFGAYSSVPSPPGYTGTGSARSYARAAASTYSWAAGKVTASTSMNVGGRAVPMTVRFTAAADAALQVARTIKGHPAFWGGVAVASFLAPIIWDAVEERWGVEESEFQECWGTAHDSPDVPGPCPYSSSAAAIAADAAWGMGGSCGALNQVTYSSSAEQVTYHITTEWCGAYSWRQVTRLSVIEVPGVIRPATEEDWEEVEAKPFPNAVPNEVVIPVPVEYPPVLNPQPDGDPGTLRVPLGEPYAVPGTDPLEYRQPAVDIVPSPTLDDPLRVDLQPKNLSPESPEDGLDDPELVGDGDEVGDPDVDLPPSKLCEDYPDISACANLGDAPADAPIPTVVKQADLSETVSFGPDTAACPADRVMSTNLAGDLHFSWAGACTFADGIRPVVIGLAYLGAVGSFFGFGRRD